MTICRVLLVRLVDATECAGAMLLNAWNVEYLNAY